MSPRFLKRDAALHICVGVRVWMFQFYARVVVELELRYVAAKQLWSNFSFKLDVDNSARKQLPDLTPFDRVSFNSDTLNGSHGIVL